ncbi:MAG TPA: hypothetical protein VMT86_08310 [Bryobacteraceae bacterium]|nr:hypothetical protein [Bryobacteraceae bacterium]
MTAQNHVPRTIEKGNSHGLPDSAPCVEGWRSHRITADSFSGGLWDSDKRRAVGKTQVTDSKSWPVLHLWRFLGTKSCTSFGNLISCRIVNWEKGFKRLFIVAVVCWFGFWLLAGLNGQMPDTFIIFVVVTPIVAYFLFSKYSPGLARDLNEDSLIEAIIPET